uniref:Uncharacterized protein n=1 Tax=Romanomermis culicivorax TaxID=13658 RepID=A0A915JLY8_ROMCU
MELCICFLCPLHGKSKVERSSVPIDDEPNGKELENESTPATPGQNLQLSSGQIMFVLLKIFKFVQPAVAYKWCCDNFCQSVTNFFIEAGKAASWNGEALFTNLGDIV